MTSGVNLGFCKHLVKVADVAASIAAAVTNMQHARVHISLRANSSFSAVVSHPL
jgi:hypothetical protein